MLTSLSSSGSLVFVKDTNLASTAGIEPADNVMGPERFKQL